MTSKTKKDLTFAEARARLDAILAELEADAGDVDQLAARLKEASELIRFCRDRLSAARHEVRQVVAELAPEAAAASESARSADTSASAANITGAGSAGEDPPPTSEPDVDDGPAADLPF